MIQEAASQSSNSQTMEPGLSIPSEICSILLLQHSSEALRSKEEAPSTLIFARNDYKYSQRRHVSKPEMKPMDAEYEDTKGSSLSACSP
jgi:hypothetical protein